jgi:peptidoglycan hydrolase FlgJ
MNAVPVASKIEPGSPLYQRLHKQATDLEGVFLNTLMKEMFSAIKTDADEFGGGFGEETWRDMQAEQLADTMARHGGIGLADQLMPTLLSMQEAKQPLNTGA